MIVARRFSSRIAVAVALAGATSCQPFPPDEDPARRDQADTVWELPIQTQRKVLSIDVISRGADPSFDQLFASPFDPTKCSLSKQISRISDKNSVALTYYFTKTKLEDVLKLGGKLELDVPITGGGSIGASAELSFSKVGTSDEEALYAVATGYTGFNVGLTAAAIAEFAKKENLTQEAQDIVDDVNDGTLTPEQGALKWIDRFGPGYVRETEHAAKMQVLYKFKNSDTVDQKDIGGKLAINAKFGVIKVEGSVQADVAFKNFMNKSEVSAYVAADGFLIPSGGSDEKGSGKLIFEQFLQPALKKGGMAVPADDSGPFSSVANAIGQVYRAMDISARRDLCAAIGSLRIDGDATVGKSQDACIDNLKTVTKVPSFDDPKVMQFVEWDGRVAPYASIRALIPTPYTQIPKLFDCINKDKRTEFVNAIDRLAKGSFSYFDKYRRLIYAGDHVAAQFNGAMSDPGKATFPEANVYMNPKDSDGYKARFSGNLDFFNRSNNLPATGTPALADRKYTELLQAEIGGTSPYQVATTQANFCARDPQFYGGCLGGIKDKDGNDYVPPGLNGYDYKKSAPVVKDPVPENPFKNLLAVLKQYIKWDWCPRTIPFVAFPTTIKGNAANFSCKAGMDNKVIVGVLPKIGQLPFLASMVAVFTGTNQKLWVNPAGICADATKPLGYVTIDTTQKIGTTAFTTMKNYAAADVTCVAAADAAADANMLCVPGDDLFGEADLVRKGLLNF